MCFAAMGLCFNALARGYDFFSYYFTVILTPMTFLSGVYFPVDALPHWLQVIGRALPLAAAVELARPLALGQAPAGALRSALMLLAYTVVALLVARTLTHRRFAT
jgi:lipooligosaccharide transport system permease protein